MEVLLDLTTEEGFTPAPDLEGVGPVSDEEALENIRKSVWIDAPLFVKKDYRSDAAVYVGAGPSMPSFLDKIRQKKAEGQFIITSNMTNDWLVERGIIPDAVILIDPKERVSRYVKKPQKETQFYVGVVCNEGVAKGLLEKGMKVEKLLIAYGMKDEADIKLQEELYGSKKDYLIGGTMTGLRIMNFSIMLGFRTLEIFGVDSCYSAEPPRLVTEDDPLYADAIKSNENVYYEDPKTNKKYAIYDPPEGGWFYAYKKKHHGALQIAKCPDGRLFWTSPVFAHQAKQFIKWYDRFEDKLTVIVHGDNLTSHLLKCHLAGIERKKKLIGDRIWTDKYKPTFFDFFAKGDHLKYSTETENIIQSGAIALSDSLKREVTLFNYDKYILEDKPREGRHDIVFSTNLLEHIEIEAIDNVLKEIKALAKYMIIIEVSLGESREKLPNGEDAHITLKSAKWWQKELNRYFEVVEGRWKGGDYALFICQALDARETREKE